MQWKFFPRSNLEEKNKGVIFLKVIDLFTKRAGCLVCLPTGCTLPGVSYETSFRALSFSLQSCGLKSSLQIYSGKVQRADIPNNPFNV